MKKILYILLFLSFSTCIQAGEKLRVYTPFGNILDYPGQPFEKEWTEADLEECYQKWLYTGGVFSSDDGGLCWKEMNNFLDNHEINAICNNETHIFLATNDGIYKSPINYNKENGWRERMLSGKIINTVYSEGTNLVLASVSDSSGVSTLQYSHDGGNNWTIAAEIKTNRIIRYIKSIVIGTDDGLWESFDNGKNWSQFGLNNSNISVNELFAYKDIDGDYLIACTNKDLYFSDDFGQTWERKRIIIGEDNNVLSIINSDIGLIIGTEKSGVWISNDNGKNWKSERYGLPRYDDGDKKSCYAVNTLYFDGKYTVIAGLEGARPYRMDINEYIAWTMVPRGIDSEVNCRRFLTINNKLYAIFGGGAKYPNSNVYDYHNKKDGFPHFKFDVKDIPKYNCHGFAWHFSEGGRYPFESAGSPILESSDERVYISEGSYREINPGDEEDMKNWAKVTYGSSHAGVRSNEGDGRSVSKWGRLGPLMEHDVLESPYSPYNFMIQYWTNVIEISDSLFDVYSISQDGRDLIQIGKRISTKETSQSGEFKTTIKKGENVEFRVAPMIGAEIVLKPGFRAEEGSQFRAYVQGRAPWEDKIMEEGDTHVDDSNSDDFFNIPDVSAYEFETELIVAPNPAADNIIIKVKPGERYKPSIDKILVYNSDGSIVGQYNNIRGDSFSIGLRKYSSGLHFLEIYCHYYNGGCEKSYVSAEPIIIAK